VRPGVQLHITHHLARSNLKAKAYRRRKRGKLDESKKEEKGRACCDESTRTGRDNNHSQGMTFYCWKREIR
jgi:hypothetical protein